MQRIVRIAAMLLPLAVFCGVILYVRRLFGQGEALAGIVIALGSVAALALCEGLMLRFWLLPALGRAIGERLFIGGYTPGQDALLALAARIRKERDLSLLPELEKIVLQDATRSRAWIEWAAVLDEVARDPREARRALLQGAERVRGKEDKAMLLYRAARLSAARLGDAQLAHELYGQAANRFPRTAYGRQAAARMAERR